jgi:hypothetical protein
MHMQHALYTLAQLPALFPGKGAEPPAGGEAIAWITMLLAAAAGVAVWYYLNKRPS